jgi:D-beta-D-heptose 7-phosphate kinase/D-beta-D-heptose 1-phosphate adenosyltransferase
MIDLARRLLTLPPQRIVCLGDLLCDTDIHGTTDRFAAEAPACPIFCHEKDVSRPGGAGAVATMAQALGANVELIHAGTSVKRRYFVDDRQVFRADEEAPCPTAQEENALTAKIALAVLQADCVLIADYGKGACTNATLHAAIEGARKKGIPCLVDPARGTDWSRYTGCTAIKCNWPQWQAWLQAPAGVKRRREEEWHAVCEYLVVTQGSRGLVLDQRGAVLPVSLAVSRERKTADVTGAGDMVLATLGVCLPGGLCWQDACWVANAAAGCKVERQGAVALSRFELLADLLHGVKVLPLDLLLACLEAHREHGGQIVFTNGCFDVLHAGHVHCLGEAKAQGDILVLGLNSDASVRSLKGPSRPVHRVEDRTAVLAGLQSVDYITVFDEQTPEKVIHAVRPHVLVKGASYAGQAIAGAEFVQAQGGRVHLVEMLAGRSSSIALTRLSEPVPLPTNQAAAS